MEQVEPKPQLFSSRETHDHAEDGEHGATAYLPKRFGIWMGLLLLIQTVLVLILTWFVQSLNQSIEAGNQRLAAQTHQTESLTQQSQMVATELQSLRQSMATRAMEDIILLKILIIRPNLDPSLAATIAKHVHHYAMVYGQDPDLVLAIIAVESNFNPNAVSHKGAVGLMQVMPHWKKVLGITEDLTHPETAIKYGLQILGFYQEMYKDIDLVLTAYNRGPGPVDMALMRERDPKNGYSDNVLKTYNRLKAIQTGTF